MNISWKQKVRSNNSVILLLGYGMTRMDCSPNPWGCGESTAGRLIIGTQSLPPALLILFATPKLIKITSKYPEKTNERAQQAGQHRPCAYKRGLQHSPEQRHIIIVRGRGCGGIRLGSEVQRKEKHDTRAYSMVAVYPGARSSCCRSLRQQYSLFLL